MSPSLAGRYHCGGHLSGLASTNVDVLPERLILTDTLDIADVTYTL
jgi:hypothetical protein